MLISTSPRADFGRIQNTLCSEADRVLDALEILLAEAERIGVDENTVAYSVARRTYDRETWSVGKVITGGTIWDRPTEPLLPSTCAALVRELRAALDGLNALVQAQGGTGVSQPPEGGGLGWLPWAVGGALGLGALVAVGYVVRSFR